MTSGPTDDDIGYAAAIAELDEILTDLDDDELDIDLLARKVARAADLIRLCRARITGARLDVEHIVAELSEDAPDDDDELADDD